MYDQIFVFFRLEYWIRFTVHFARSARTITRPKVNRFGCSGAYLEHPEVEHIVGWSRQILGAIRALATTADPGEILFLSGKQRTISPISRRPNFTKFEHNTSSARR